MAGKDARKIFESINEVEGFAPKNLAAQIGESLHLCVKDRIAWFRLKHLNGTLESEIVKIAENVGEKTIMKAYVYASDGTLLATGYGTHPYTQDNPFDEAHIESAESKAFGRALSAAGFGTQFSSDYDLPDGTVIDAGVPISEGSEEKEEKPKKRTPKKTEKEEAKASSGSLLDDLDDSKPDVFEESVSNYMKNLSPEMCKGILITYGPAANKTIKDVYREEKGEDKLATIKTYAYPKKDDASKQIPVVAGCRMFIEAVLEASKK